MDGIHARNSTFPSAFLPMFNQKHTLNFVFWLKNIHVQTIADLFRLNIHAVQQIVDLHEIISFKIQLWLEAW